MRPRIPAINKQEEREGENLNPAPNPGLKFRVRLPAALPYIAHRPVSGLASPDASPSQAFAQWPIEASTLAYRCGGSTGIVWLKHAPVSRSTAAENLLGGTLHTRFPLHCQGRDRGL